jgi:DNA (cytosine-5)-methyltransferase 1
MKDQLNELHLFAGAGGGILGGMLHGHTTVCAVELEPYCRKVLLQRQRDGILPKFPIWDDVCTFDGTPWRGKVDVVCGGFPCPDFSNGNQWNVGGSRFSGLEGSRGSLWFEMFRIVCEIRPKFVFVENVPNLVKFGVGTVLGSLAEVGYNSRWCVLGSKDCGGVHKRDRVWILAIHSSIDRLQEEQSFSPNVAAENEAAQNARITAGATGLDGIRGYVGSHIAGKNDEMARWLDRFKAIGNGQDAVVAATAWKILGGE